ncbi:hypothetical protein NSK_007680 [Nannochloropsis salina CCMP1776]|uniref:Mediator of RNA polymerase II transcription subunit 22 n=1 Tax=Nannochloropsis salina CCMP1776 TaxID=1027361 RepID=A0A4D9CSM9_9STRA|nr:hypothetical protein NSK_007680 [Nannochloropsis salina CCMP1776]|eukprot:TFJ81037.1 hypothetical protein NSK_007680 [Nannochloropsis salina CCMP1776]
MSSSAVDAATARSDPRCEFRRLVDANILKCVESMGKLIKTAKMGSTREDAHMDANRVTILTGTILQSSEQLLTQIEQLKRLHVLQDFDTLNTELDRDVISLEARIEALDAETQHWKAVVQSTANRKLASAVDGLA